MLIGIDTSRAFVSQRTGTENYSYQLIRAIAKIDRKNQYILYTRISSNCHCEETGEAGRRGNLNEEDSHAPSGLGMTKSEYPNFSVKNIPFPRLWTQLGLAKEVFLHPPDVLFIPSHTLPVIRRPGLKTVVTIHDLGYEYLPEYHQFPQKLYLNKSTEYVVKHADRLIAVSRSTKKDLRKKLGCPEKKISVVYEGFDKEKFSINKLPKSPKLLRSLKINSPYILFVGTLQPRKNLERLIEAFSLLCHCEEVYPERSRMGGNLNEEDSHGPLRGPRNDKINLVIAGNKGWLYNNILSAPKRFGVEDRVKFLGYTKEADLPALYQNALCFCLPSLFEGFGLPVLEAMACGCPVVVSNTSSLPEVAGEAGLYVNPLDVNDIAKKLELVIRNEKLRSQLRQKSLIQAQKFSWEKCAAETIKILESTARLRA